MERITRTRAIIFLLLFTVVLGLFAFRLYDLQIIETGGNTSNITTFTTMTRVKAARGDILDTNGNVLVSNRASYDLVINHYVIKSTAGTNQHLYNLVKRCQEQGIEIKEHFPISKERPFVYTLGDYSSAWQSYFQIYLANVAKLDSDITAPLLMERLRKLYTIPEEWSDEDARQVLGLWYELDLRGPVQSLPNYVFLADVSDEDLSSIMELNIPGLNVEASTVREYNTKYAAHVLGYVGAMNADQWDYYKAIPGYSMDSEIGQDGFEAAYEEYLHGIDGWRIDEVTSDGTVIESYYMDGYEPKAGSNVHVSLDITLQMAGEDTLAQVIEELQNQEEVDGKKPDGADAQGGAVVAIDVQTGKVLVSGSYPTFNLATFSQDFDKLLQQENGPLFNRALMGIYPPGSTYKMSMVIAGINSGIINSETLIYDRGVYSKYAPDFAPQCLLFTNYGMLHENVNAADALKYSCNYFFYWLGDRIRLSAMDSTAKSLGLGEHTGVELPEYIGYRANQETKKELYGDGENGWYPADQITAAIGQSDNRFTPMQLAVYASTLANRGIRYKATFLNQVVSSDYTEILLQSEKAVLSHLEISDDAYLAYTNGMYKVANEDGGTAYSVFRNYPIAIAAKTGTAETGNPSGSDNGAFICYAPIDNPRIAIAVYGEKAGHGKSMATVAKAILDVYFEIGYVGDAVVNENKPS